MSLFITNMLDKERMSHPQVVLIDVIFIHVTNVTLCYTSRMLKHLWGEPAEAPFESFGYSHINHSIQFSKQ